MVEKTIEQKGSQFRARTSAETIDALLKRVDGVVSFYGGKRITATYAGWEAAYEFKCQSKEHPVFKSSIKHVLGARWCPLCPSKRREDANYITKLISKASKLGALIQVPASYGLTSAFEIKCERNHTFRINVENIIGGRGCSLCEKENEKKRREEFQANRLRELDTLAKSREGQCLGYDPRQKKHQWKCRLGHQWFARWKNIKHGLSWCPECSSKLSEQLCRTAFQQCFKKAFPKSKPNWLKTENGRLELDGYCEELKLAFEHQGEQHYSNNAVISRDVVKRKLCEDNNVKLIVIPQLKGRLPIGKLKDEITKQCRNYNVPLPENWDAIVLNFNEAFVPRTIIEFQKLQDIALLKNGKLLSTCYLGNDEKLEFYCNVHKKSFLVSPHKIKEGVWCKEVPMKDNNFCSGVVKKSISWLNEVAAQRKGKCLSNVYTNNKEKYQWKCREEEHPPWFATTGNAKKTWCPLCNKERRQCELG